MQQSILYSNDICQTLNQVLTDIDYDKLFILTDTHTNQLCLPLLKDFRPQGGYHVITIPADDLNKDVSALTSIWMELSRSGASRRSLCLNLGGGMITDVGGFAASTFKRGIRFINIPTTLLGAVDAAVGGKTGINFNNLKNEVGVFAPAIAVLISTRFFSTIDRHNLLSGYAEMLKHGLLHDADYFNRLMSFDLEKRDPEILLGLLKESVQIKEAIVNQDPFEKGLRKALNLGHTVGHAFESYALKTENPILHGYAVAHGLVCELILSHRQAAFPLAILKSVADYVYQNYGPFVFTCKDYDKLYELMKHDKKNDDGFINFTLLSNIGEVQINQHSTREQIDIMFDIYRDLMKL